MQYSQLENILIKNSQTGFYISTIGGQLKDCNDSFANIFGYQSKDELLQLNTSVLYLDSDERTRFLKELDGKKYLKNYHLKAKSKSGNLITVSVNSDLYQETNQDMLIVGSVVDITELILSKGKLAESEKKYKDFIDNSPEIIQSFNSEGKLLFCNAIWHQKLEYTEEEAANMNLFDIIADEYKPHCSLMFQEVLSGKALKDVGVEFVSKSGKRYLLEGNVVPLLQNGQMVATHAFFRDVTEKKQAIDKIIEQEKLLQTVFNSVPICLYIKDENGNYLHANEIMQKTLGSDVLSQSDTNLFPKNCVLQLKDTDSLAIQQPESLIKFEMDVDFGYQTKHFLCGKKAIFNQEKGNYNLFGFSVDITDLKNSAAKIEENEKLLHSIINSTRGGFILFKFNNDNKNFLCEYANEFAEKVLHLREGKKEFKAIFDFLDETTQQKLSLEQIKKQESFLVTCDWKSRMPDTGLEKVFSLRFSVIKTSDNELKIIVYIIDITEEKQLIEQLEFKLKENDVLIGEVHHRVKNNLAIIDGIIELKKSKTTDEQLVENLTDIQMRIKTIALVHQKLYQSGIFSEVNLHDYTYELANYYKKLFDNKNVKLIHFDIDIQPEVSLSLSKSISFGLLLSELISNSCKYGVANDEVKIGVAIEKEQTTYKMTYTDTGNGLPEPLKQLKNGGFGFRLIENFIKQLKGTAVFPEDKHFLFEFEFIA
jgi:PAS domain S-box-containing protein